jgi:hypothetical protein
MKLLITYYLSIGFFHFLSYVQMFSSALCSQRATVTLSVLTATKMDEWDSILGRDKDILSLQNEHWHLGLFPLE